MRPAPAQMAPSSHAGPAAPVATTGHLSGSADWLLLLGPGLIWGASFLFIAEGLTAVEPNGLTFLRIAIGFLTLALFPAARAPVPRRAWGAIALLGVLWMAFPLSMFPYAEQRVSSAITGMLNGANPLFTALVTALLYRQRPSGGVMVGLVVGLSGTALMAWPSLHEGHSSTVGVVLILAGVLSYGFALNVARPLQQRHGALPVIWRAQAVALLLTAPLGVPELLDSRWTLEPLLAMIALGAFGTAVANVLMAIAAGRLGATKASATTFLIPAVALALGVLVRGERVTAVAIGGAAVCVAGAWLMRRVQLGRS